MIDSEEPTGRWRHRSEHKWGRERLVLQIEVKRHVIYWSAGGADSRDVVIWRDAVTTDLTVLNDASAFDASV